MKKGKKFFLLFFSGVLFALTILLSTNIKHKNCMDSVRFVFSSGGLEQHLYLHKSEGVYYAFLPSYVKLEESRIESELDYTVMIDGEVRIERNFCVGMQLNTEYRITLTNSLGIGVADEKIVIMQAENVPSFSIVLTDGSLKDIHSDKKISREGYLLVTESDESVNYAGSFKSIHGRGSSSWVQEKKPYAIEFEEDVSLLGMDEGKNWVLVSNAYDESSLRNKLVYDAAKEFGLKYAVDSRFIDLYIDSQYLGLYLLCEKIEVSETRINIQDLQAETQRINSNPLSSFSKFEEEVNGLLRKGFNVLNDPEDISGGYLLQIDNHDVYDEEDSFFYTASTPFIVSSPKQATKKQIQYISNYVSAAEEELLANNLSKLDVDSFVDYYLIMEFFANVDNSSVFIVKNSDAVDGKIVAGPVWDYDLSIGNNWEKTASSPQILYAKRINWFEYLCENETFTELVKEKYSNSFQPWIEIFVHKKLIEYNDLMSSSFLMDKLRWKHLEGLDSSINKSQQRFNTLDEHIKQIETYLTIRSNHLYELWVNGETFYTVSFSSPPKNHQNFVLRYGEVLGDVSLPKETPVQSGLFLGWFDEQGNEYIPGRQITRDESYNACWQNSEELNNDIQSSAKNSQSKVFYLDMIDELLRGEIEVLMFGMIGLIVMYAVSSDVLKMIKSRRNKK